MLKSICSCEGFGRIREGGRGTMLDDGPARQHEDGREPGSGREGRGLGFPFDRGKPARRSGVTSNGFGHQAESLMDRG